VRLLFWRNRDRRAKHRRGSGPLVPDLPVGLTDLEAQAREAEEAKARADRALREAISRSPEVNRLSNTLRRIRERNKFAEMLNESFKRDHA
jgi:hypothetical protein